MNRHKELATEAIGFAPKTFTDAEWKVEAERIRKMKVNKEPKHEWSEHDGVRYCPHCGQDASRQFLKPCKRKR